jgi:hypothetical protein
MDGASLAGRVFTVTVTVHRANIMKTLGINRATMLIAHAIRHRLVVVP